MPQFDIETYEVHSTAFPKWHRRYLMLVSPDLSHGIRHRVHMHFSSSPMTFNNGRMIGVAGNVGGLNFDGVNFAVYFRDSAFDEIYEILRSENPVSFKYFLRDIATAPEATAKWVSSAGIVTGPERLGEGPADADAGLLQARMLLGDLAPSGDGLEHAVQEPEAA
ncbi:hypothetical protein RQM47_13710 [Rubrivirga sp. S365]|uniref:Uncharacterized protein n=1 Tax=Rubrivirga litoralis TaxID=3075598 RepID=A0ABU3BMR2_9BACT|nr:MULTISPECIES: hypothetical protein [unclassified Rubrivirga]MDT0630585.1 hypothetical protein [Rubrivirga sp. F394]MDT7857703.1 hypothetical protein [Rubrivirga sp. S365]